MYELNKLMIDDFQIYIKALEMYLVAKNPAADRNIPKSFICICNEEGINGIYAFAYSSFITNFFRFSNKNKNKYNYMKLKNQDGSLIKFSSIDEGVRVLAQYLKFVSTTDDIINPYEKIKNMSPDIHGKYPTVEELEHTFLSPGYDKNKYSSLEEAKKAGDSFTQSVIKIIKDIDDIADKIRCELVEEAQTISVIRSQSTDNNNDDSIESDIIDTSNRTNINDEIIDENKNDTSVKEDNLYFTDKKYKVAYIDNFFLNKIDSILPKFKGISFTVSEYQAHSGCEVQYLAVFDSFDDYSEAVKKKKELLGKGIRVKIYE